MAGSFPDPPGSRLAYDRDGTLGYARWGTEDPAVLGTPLTQAELAQMNDEAPATGPSLASTRHAVYVLIFPSLRDISHIHAAIEHNSYVNFFWSPDTTNGVDGTWNPVAVTTLQASTRTQMRTQFTATPAILGAKGLRYIIQGGALQSARTYALHLYGKPTILGDRLEFWHPTLNQPLRDTPAALDWGNRPRGTIETKQVRVRNCSSTLTANGVVVGMEVLTDASPSLLSQHQFSYNGGAFGATAALGSLAPETISEIVTIRQDLLATAATSLWDQRIVADASGWS